MDLFSTKHFMTLYHSVFNCHTKVLNYQYVRFQHLRMSQPCNYQYQLDCIWLKNEDTLLQCQRCLLGSFCPLVSTVLYYAMGIAQIASLYL